MGNPPYSTRSNHAEFGASLEWQSLPEVGADRRGGHGSHRLFIALAGFALVVAGALIGILV